MKGWIVISSSGNFLTPIADIDEAEPLREWRGRTLRWTDKREEALRFASKTQAIKAASIYPGAAAVVQKASA